MSSLREPHEHDLSYTLKTDGKENLVAIVDQMPSVIVTGTLSDMDDKVNRAILQHFVKFEPDHIRVYEDPSPIFKDNGVGITVGRKQIKVKC